MKRKKALQFILIYAIIFGLIIFSGNSIIQWSISRSWEKAYANVENIDGIVKGPDRYGNNNTTYYNETYSYTVDGKKYNFKIMLQNKNSLTIRYNPNDPNQITMDRGFPSWWGIAGTILGIGLLYWTSIDLLKELKKRRIRALPSGRKARKKKSVKAGSKNST